MADNFAMSFACPNFSGLLFRKGVSTTPLSTLISGKAYYTDHVEFATGQQYSIAEGTQPAISEKASLTAPDATFVKRTQDTNVTQIFQYTFGVSDAKRSNMGTLSGINAANQTANPIDEVTFQATAAMQKAAQDIEYTFVNGTKQKASNDDTANKTCGIVNAITSNTIDASSAELNYWLLVEAAKKVNDNGGDSYNLVTLLNGNQMLQVQKNAIENGLQVLTSGETQNGINITKIITPYGDIRLALGRYIPEGTAILINPTVMAPVYQNVPGKGNFYLEELAKTGAGTRYMIFGQAGLDYGPEWYHAKITGLKTTFEAPANGILTREAAAAAG